MNFRAKNLKLDLQKLGKSQFWLIFRAKNRNSFYLLDLFYIQIHYLANFSYTWIFGQKFDVLNSVDICGSKRLKQTNDHLDWNTISHFFEAVNSYHWNVMIMIVVTLNKCNFKLLLIAGHTPICITNIGPRASITAKSAIQVSSYQAQNTIQALVGLPFSMSSIRPK